MCYGHHVPRLRPELRSGTRRNPPSAPHQPAPPTGTRPGTDHTSHMVERSRDGDGRLQARHASRVGCRRGASSGGCAGGPWWGSRGGGSACTCKKAPGGMVCKSELWRENAPLLGAAHVPRQAATNPMRQRATVRHPGYPPFPPRTRLPDAGARLAPAETTQQSGPRARHGHSAPTHGRGMLDDLP